jgi:hypothetical protein
MSDSSDDEDHNGGGGGGDGPGDNDPEPGGGGHGDATGRVDWVARVAMHTEQLYDLITNGNCHSGRTLIQLNMSLAMAAHDNLYNEPPLAEEGTVLRHAGAACEFMNTMKRRRIQ